MLTLFYSPVLQRTRTGMHLFSGNALILTLMLTLMLTLFYSAVLQRVRTGIHLSGRNALTHHSVVVLLRMPMSFIQQFY